MRLVPKKWVDLRPGDKTKNYGMLLARVEKEGEDDLLALRFEGDKEYTWLWKGDPEELMVWEDK